MISRRWLGPGVVLTCGILAAALVTPSASAAPLPPQDDPFYQPPAGYQTTAPGTVLRARSVDVAAFAALPQQVTAWQVLYRTTDTQGQPEATVTTVLEPANAAPSASRPLLSYQVAEDSPAAQCAMSYELQQGAGNQNAIEQVEILLIDAALRNGWAVTVPDYEGPDSAFVAGQQAGHAVLDAIRATENLPAAGLNGVHTYVGVWGYSGGALASGWAAELQSSYAPELNIKGVAEGGLPVDPGNVLTKINGGPFAGIAMSGIAGLRHAYPQLDQFLDANLTPAGSAAFAQAATQCLQQNSQEFAFTNVFNYFSVPNPLDLPVPQQVLRDDTLGSHTPAAPLFVYQSTNDELIPPADVDNVVNTYCAGGGRVTYQRDILSEHVSLAVVGGPDALNWLSARLSGTPAAPGCHTSTVASSLLSPTALLTFGSQIYGDLLALLGQPVGPGTIF